MLISSRNSTDLVSTMANAKYAGWLDVVPPQNHNMNTLLVSVSWIQEDDGKRELDLLQCRVLYKEPLEDVQCLTKNIRLVYQGTTYFLCGDC